MNDKMGFIKYCAYNSIIKEKLLKESKKQALINKGFKPSEHNLKVLSENRLTRTLEERSIEEGWDIIYDILCICKDQLE